MAPTPCPRRSALGVPARAASVCAALLAAAMASGDARAQTGAPPPGSAVHKCRGERGVPIYQETPCEPGRELRDFGADPPTVSVIPFGGPGSSSLPPSPARGERGNRETRDKRPGEPSTTATARAEERRHLHVGMTEAEVRARLGPPEMTSGKSGKVRWSYLPAPGDPSTITTVRLENGRVVAVDRNVVR
jgi:hypothetical protein